MLNYAHQTKRWLLALALFSFVIIPLGSVSAQRPSPSPDSTHHDPGSLDARSKDGKELGRFPLQHTHVDAKVSGFLNRVTVTQFYSNPYEESIEAIYTFPLPDTAAVDDMEMIVGKKTIRGLIKKREEAKKIYDAAKRRGNTASLLTQERANIFTQAVANIHPGDSIKIKISYVEVLKYEAGRYTFRFPMVVGPRYVPGVPLNQAQTGTGFAPDTNMVPDASRITPPVLKPGQRSGHDISVRVQIDAGVSIHKLSTPSHKIKLNRDGESKASITLDPNDTIPNKDLVIHYHVAGERPELAVLAHADPKNGGHFMLMVQPKASFQLREITAKEMYFVVDNSGSMGGRPMNAAKALIRKAVKEMNPDDTFQILRFSERASGMAPHAIPNTPTNIKKGIHYINRMRGMGGTNMIEGIKAALDAPRDPERIRIVMFLTDGYIGNDKQILAAIKSKIGNARLFSFGVGSSTNTYLLNNMAWIGRGAVDYLRADQKPTEFVDRFFNRISSPFLTDISVDWNGLDIMETYPRAIPDLFTGQPLVVYGRYNKGGQKTIKVHGKIAGRDTSFNVPVTLPQESSDHDTIPKVWARKKIARLSTDLLNSYNPKLDRNELVQTITQTALDYRLMSQYTAFVAVEETVRRTPSGDLVRVTQPVELPQHVSHEGVFGHKTKRKAYAPRGSRLSGSTGGTSYSFSGSGMGGGGAGYGRFGKAATKPQIAPSGLASGDEGVIAGQKDQKICTLTRRKEDVDRDPARKGVQVRLSSIQGGSKQDQHRVRRWFRGHLRSQSNCLARRAESTASTLKLKLHFDKSGGVAKIEIVDQGKVSNLTLRCILFAFQKVSGPRKVAGTYKVQLRIK